MKYIKKKNQSTYTITLNFCNILILGIAPEIDVTNFDLENIYTPVNVEKLVDWMAKANYDKNEISFLKDGFTNGFDIGYRGPHDRRDRAPNPLFRIGNKQELWCKLMTETKQLRYAGPFEEIPFENYVQSPVGLVPKAGNKTRLIFHLSYNFKNGNMSINANTPKDICSVKYQDLDYAVGMCLACLWETRHNLRASDDRDDDNSDGEGGGMNRERSVSSSSLWLEKSDLRSAFRMLPVKRTQWKFLFIKATRPDSKETVYFFDKCLPFGASISCSHFQHFSNALKHVVEYAARGQNRISNYLDDFLFMERTCMLCNRLVKIFIKICEEINFPVAEDKMDWASFWVVFLGMLMDGKRQLIVVPNDKRTKALDAVSVMA